MERSTTEGIDGGGEDGEGKSLSHVHDLLQMACSCERRRGWRNGSKGVRDGYGGG